MMLSSKGRDMKNFLLHLILIVSAGLLLNTGCDIEDPDVPDYGSLKVAKIEDIASFNGLTDSSWNSIDELAVYVTSFNMMGMMIAISFITFLTSPIISLKNI